MQQTVGIVPRTRRKKFENASAYKFRGRDAACIENSPSEDRPMFNFLINRTDDRCHTIDGKHPDGGSSGEAEVPLQQSGKGGEEYLHAPAG